MTTTDSRRPQPRATDRLTPHFRVREFDCHDGAPVPPAAYPALRELCERYLEPLRERFGVGIVVSGFRHRAYNDRVGGARRSMHVYEEHPAEVGADVRFATGKPRDWAQLAERLGAPGVGRYDTSGFVHIDTRNGATARWSG